MTEIKPTPEDYQHIKEKIIDYLARQGFSEKKLMRKVTDLKRHYPRTKRYFFYIPEHVQKVINQLKEQGIINDHQYAEEVLCQLRDKKDGIHRIRQKMFSRLIPVSIIEKVLASWKEQGSKQDFARIIREAKRKYERLLEKFPNKKDSYTIQSKMYAFLAQKGYTSEEVKKIIENIKK